MDEILDDDKSEVKEPISVKIKSKRQIKIDKKKEKSTENKAEQAPADPQIPQNDPIEKKAPKKRGRTKKIPDKVPIEELHLSQLEPNDLNPEKPMIPLKRSKVEVPQQDCCSTLKQGMELVN